MAEQDECSQISLGNPAVYRIRIGGDLNNSWSGYLGGLAIEQTGGTKDDSVTVLTGELIDQAALVGVLNNLYSLGFPLLSVECINVASSQPGDQDIRSTPSVRGL